MQYANFRHNNLGPSKDMPIAASAFSAARCLSDVPDSILDGGGDIGLVLGTFRKRG